MLSDGYTFNVAISLRVRGVDAIYFKSTSNIAWQFSATFCSAAAF
jgi:hypothetical protein